MLNTETKRRIDTARDILVGKVPDPKTQVEQITFAMIYKFMDDMDQLSVRLGGNPSFFANGYEQYAWSKLMDRKISGADRLDLYVRALDQMAQNPHIPQLFRDVFKGAFLPYRDSETLNLFLKEMNGFTYAHSEDLGDAYEYLLSIFATQGKAGQFRTPRHIIDFIVDCVDPDLNDTVLDPACGTAGFLISAYKHILEKHADNPLTPDQKKRLTENFVGYDISPDMVRLSRVNMYLHQFPNPTIFEYDTLTTEDRWEDTFDVILANPPFMTPKGGIRPHKRFAVRANRSEVLFVDYIAEHLNVGGRAGVIVPEGIIFQSSNAYKALRKMLVEEGYLYAVVSLPAGIFNPYSNVKTSVLLMDKELAKARDSILFVKVENDGYDLGAQRSPIEKNDLPEALKIIKVFQTQSDESLHELNLANKVRKEKLRESGDYSLSGEKYKATLGISSQFKLVKLGDIANIYQPKTITSKDLTDSGQYKVFGANGVIGFYTEYNHEHEEVLVTCRGATCGTINMSEPRSWITGNAMVVSPKNSEVLNKKFLYYLLQNTDLTSAISGSAQPQITRNSLDPFLIPLPPLEVQQEIVDEIEGYQKVIDGARQVVENYKPVIHIDPAWPLVNLGEVCEFKRGPFGGSLKKEIFVKEGFKVYEQKNAINDDFSLGSYYITYEKFLEMEKFSISAKDLIISCSGTMGKIAIVPSEFEPGIINQALLKLTPIEGKVLSKYIKLILETAFIQTKYFTDTSGAAIKNVASVKVLKEIEIPLPDLSVQEIIIGDIQKEMTMVDSNKELIKLYEKKISECINRVWEDR